jgi:mRNA interferase MazF
MSSARGSQYISTIIVAPLTSKARDYPSRVSCTFQGQEGQIVLDQIRTVDRARLVKRLGAISEATQKKTLQTLSEMFAL